MSDLVKYIVVFVTAFLNTVAIAALIAGVFFEGGIQTGAGPLRQAEQGDVLMIFVWVMLNLATCAIAARKGSDQ